MFPNKKRPAGAGDGVTDLVFKEFNRDGQPNVCKAIYQVMRSVNQKYDKVKKVMEVPVIDFHMELHGAMVSKISTALGKLAIAHEVASNLDPLDPGVQSVIAHIEGAVTGLKEALGASSD